MRVRKKRASSIVTLITVLVALFVFAGEASATTTNTELHVNNPPTACVYGRADVNATEPTSGDAAVSFGQTYLRSVNPCSAGTTFGSPSAGVLKVQVALDCRTDTGGGVWSPVDRVWTGNLKSNTAGSGTVSGQLMWSDFHSPSYDRCVSTEANGATNYSGVQYRTKTLVGYCPSGSCTWYDTYDNWEAQPFEG